MKSENKKQIFSVVGYCGGFVDENLLNKGIYFTEIPRLHLVGTTIESMLEQGKRFIDLNGNTFLSPKYFESLSQCTMIEVELNIL